jgi:hypothetical protein
VHLCPLVCGELPQTRVYEQSLDNGCSQNLGRLKQVLNVVQPTEAGLVCKWMTTPDQIGMEPIFASEYEVHG